MTTNGTVLVHRTMSLDGFVAGPKHEMDWVFEHPAPADAGDIMRATGAIVAGRNTWEIGERDTGRASEGPYGGAWSGPVFVLSHRPLEQTPVSSLSHVSGDIRDVIARAKEAAGGKVVELFGSDVARQAFDAGLVDEVLVHVVPVLLGTGIPFSRGGGRVDLEPVALDCSGPVAHLRYRVRR